MAKRVSYLLSIILLTHNQHVHSSPNFLIFYIDGQPMAGWKESEPDPFLHNYKVKNIDAPTPNINSFRSEAIVFSRSYTGGSVCSPSRFSLLTGRYAVRSKYAAKKSLLEDIGLYGTFTSGGWSMMTGYDNNYNLIRTMQSAGYYTALSGKWHLLAANHGGSGDYCDSLTYIPDLVVYEHCIQTVADQAGFDFVDALYVQNIEETSPYTHNPEWVVSQAQKAITAAVDANKPFFLYLAPTLEHNPKVESAHGNSFTDHDYTESPKGILTGDDIPDDTLMTPRADLWQYLVENGYKHNPGAAWAIWLDDMFGAVINYLKSKDLFDNTFIMFGNDHGVKGRDTPYEQGIRTMQFIRYPKLFPVTDGPFIVSEDLITAGYDIPAVIYEIVGIDIDDEYVMDGESWLKDVQNMLSGTEDDISCCKERYSDIWYSHAIVHNHYKYMFKPTNTDLHWWQRIQSYWPYYFNLEQMYDLDTDPSEQYNLLMGSMTHEEQAKARTFSAKMDVYIADVTCPLTDGACMTPGTMIRSDDVCVNELGFEKQWDGIIDADYDVDVMLSEAEQEITCDYSEYAYKFKETENVLILDVIVCCGSSGSFRGAYDEMYTVKRALNVAGNDALNVVQNDALNEVRKDKKRFYETDALLLWIVAIGLFVVYCVSALFCVSQKGEYVTLLNNANEPNTYDCPSV